MKVVIRADSSTAIGTGHVMRCLTLADTLRERGADVVFLCGELPGNISAVVVGKGFSVRALKPDETMAGETGGRPADVPKAQEILRAEAPVDWLVVDNYRLDKRWESAMRPLVGRIMVIDDLADRPHDCDLLLDQNLYQAMHRRYKGLIPKHCRQLLGPRFALLRAEFSRARATLRERDGRLRNLLISFGGSDPTNETRKALNAIDAFDTSGLRIRVVVGSANPYRDEVAAACSKIANASFRCQVDNMAELVAEADLVMGAGGTTTWERCYLGVPALTVVVAENQAEMTEAVAATGACLNLGWHANVGVDDMAKALQWALLHPSSLQEMGRKAMELMGDGNLSALTEILFEGSK